MKRVLAVLISVLVAAWPLLLPQTTSANPCGVTTAENGSIYAKAGHYFGQQGDLWADQHGSAVALAGGGYGGTGNGGGAYGGTGEGALALNVNVQKAKGGEAYNTPIAANVQVTDNTAKAYGDSNGGDATGGTNNSSATQTSSNSATGGTGGGPSANGGYGGHAGALALTAGVQIPVAVSGYAGGGTGGTGGNGGSNTDSVNVPVNVPVELGTGNNAAQNEQAAKTIAGDGGNANGTGGTSGDAGSLAAQKGSADAWGGKASGGDAQTGSANGGGASSGSLQGQASTATGANADGGNGGNRTLDASSKQFAGASNEGNKAIADGGKNVLLSNNSAAGGTGGAATGGVGTGGPGSGGAAQGLNEARTVGSNTKSISDIDAVSTSVSVGGASGDPCKQIIKDSTGVLAINGVNDIKGSNMQQSTTSLGNAANNSVNASDLSKQLNLSIEVPYNTKMNGGYPNININPNNNQNTNIISF